MRRLSRGGSVLVLFTLLLALTGVASASPHHSDAADRGRNETAKHHDSGAGEGRHNRSGADGHDHGRSNGTLAARPALHKPGSARIARAAGMTPMAAAPVGAAPSSAAAPAGVAPTPTVVAVHAAQPLSRFTYQQGRVVPVDRTPALRPAAGRAADAPWYLSLGAGIPLSSTFGTGELRAAVRLSVPIALAGVVLIFLIIQALIDRREPKLTEEPIWRRDDGMSFE